MLLHPPITNDTLRAGGLAVCAVHPHVLVFTGGAGGGFRVPRLAVIQVRVKQVELRQSLQLIPQWCSQGSLCWSLRRVWFLA